MKNRLGGYLSARGQIGAMIAIAVGLTAIPVLRASDVEAASVLAAAPVMSGATGLTFDDQPTQDIFRFSMLATTDPSTQPQQDHSLFPFFAEEARSRGYDLPEPFGMAGMYQYLQRDITISDLRIGLNGAAPQSVSKFVNVGSDVRVNAALAKIDAFVFPFLDVYAVVGYLDESTTTSGVATIPLPGPGHAMQNIAFSGVTKVSGPATGVGFDLAGGYKQLFVSVDTSFTVTDLGFDDNFRAFLISLRTGWNGKLGNIPVRLWTGAEYWDTASTASATISLSNGQRLSFEADQRPTHPVDMLFGTIVGLGKHLDLLVEYETDFDDMQGVTGGIEVRF